jgi:hypothetical protein
MSRSVTQGATGLKAQDHRHRGPERAEGVAMNEVATWLLLLSTRPPAGLHRITRRSHRENPLWRSYPKLARAEAIRRY